TLHDAGHERGSNTVSRHSEQSALSGRLTRAFQLTEKGRDFLAAKVITYALHEPGVRLHEVERDSCIAHLLSQTREHLSRGGHERILDHAEPPYFPIIGGRRMR